MTEGHSPFATVFYTTELKNLRILNGHPSHYKAALVKLRGKSICEQLVDLQHLSMKNMLPFVPFISISVRDRPGFHILFLLKFPSSNLHYNLSNNDIMVAAAIVVTVALIIPLTEGPIIEPSI